MRLTVGFLAALLILSCLVPEAEPIQGDVATAIEKGISKGNRTFDHRVWDEILQRYAKEEGSKFDYTGLKNEEDKLDGYLRRLNEVDLSTLPGNELLALFANAYNAYTVKTILAEISSDGTYRIKSIRDISKAFDRETHRVGGFILSLDNIEHNIIRPTFKDPRAHFAVNCASTSCPPIPTRAFTGRGVDEQFEEVTRAVLSSPDYVRVENGRLMVTRIMDWYGSDFLTEGYKGSEKDLAAFIRKYTREEVRSWIELQTSTADVKFMKYDWNLNRY
jgi:hypothetical protein